MEKGEEAIVPNIVKAVNTQAVSLPWYWAGSVDWTKSELANLERKTANEFNMNGADVEILHLPKKKSDKV